VGHGLNTVIVGRAPQAAATARGRDPPRRTEGTRLDPAIKLTEVATFGITQTILAV